MNREVNLVIAPPGGSDRLLDLPYNLSVCTARIAQKRTSSTEMGSPKHLSLHAIDLESRQLYTSPKLRHVSGSLNRSRFITLVRLITVQPRSEFNVEVVRLQEHSMG